MERVFETVTDAFVITGFVFITMVALEYVSVLTRGRCDAAVRRWRWGQSLLGAFLGATPGCLGTYAVASFYTHRLFTFGAMLAGMIATCGDEAFLMLALFPGRALAIFGILFAMGLAGGMVTDLVLRSRLTAPRGERAYTPVHVERPECLPFSRRELAGQWRNCSPQRGLLTAALALFLIAVLSGHVGHKHLGFDPVHHGHADSVPAHAAAVEAVAAPADAVAHAGHTHAAHEDAGHAHAEWDWVRLMLLALGLVGLAIVATVPDHFLDEHLWQHIVLVHMWRILLWTIGALAATHLLVSVVDIERLVTGHKLPILLLAGLVGIIPQSGPHLVFVTLYANGSIPFSILLANSIVQDGHGAIPLLAHSRRAFAGVKLIKFALGMAVGIAGHALGF